MSKFYNEKKKLLRLPILAVILLFFILSANHVFSSGKLEVLIEFNEDEWNLNEPFSDEREWLTNEKKIEFMIDLSHYYDDSHELSEPFNLSATYLEEAIEADSITQIEQDEDDFKGKYQVVYVLGEENGTLDLELKFEEEHEWEIPTDKNPIEFSVIKDAESPEISISGVEDGAVFYSQSRPVYPEFKIAVSDSLMSADLIGVYINGEWIDMDWIEEVNTFNGNYQTEEDGVYHLEVKSEDRAGNSASKELTFYVNNAGPDLELSSAGQLIEQSDYVTNDKIKLQINNNAPIAEVDLVIEKDGEVYDELADIEIDNTSAGLIHVFDEGAYQISGTVKDVGEKDISHEIDPIHFIVDVSKPEMSLLDSNGEPFEGPYQEPQGKAVLSIADQNMDFDLIDLSIVRESLTGAEDVEYTKASNDNPLEIVFEMDQKGVYHITATATDLAGHIKEFQQSIVVDLDNPVIDIADADTNKLADIYLEPVELTFLITGLTLTKEKTIFNIEKYNRRTDEFEAYLTKEDLEFSDFSVFLAHEFDEGRYQIGISAEDAFGRKTAIEQSFLVDLNDPEIKFGSLIESGDHITSESIEENLFSLVIEEEFLDSKNVTVTRTDANGDEVKITEADLGEWHQNEEQPKQSSFIFNENIWQEEGHYDIEIKAIDQAGRESEEAFSFTLDNTAPVIEVSELAKYYNEDVEVEVKVKETNYETNDVTVTIKRQNTEGEFKEYDDSFSEWKNDGIVSLNSYLFTSDGTYQIEVTAIDKAGNQVKHEEQEFAIHRYAPNISIAGVEDGQHYNQDLEVELSITSIFLDTNNSSIIIEKWDQENEKFKLYSNESEESRIPLIRLKLTETLSEPGDYRIRLTGQDLAGNISEPKEVQFVIDKQKPIVSVEGIDNEAVYEENQTIELSIIEKYYETNNVTLTVKHDDEDISDQVEEILGSDWMRQAKESIATYETTLEGDYVIRLEATDKAGNKADPVEKSFAIDSSSPTISIEGVGDHIHYAESRTMKVDIRDRNFDTNKIDVFKDGEEYVVGDFEITRRFFQDSIAKLEYTFEEEGTYQVSIKSIDLSNNLSETAFNFTIDKTEPTIELGKEMPSFITTKAIEDQGINQLIPITIHEQHIKKKDVTISRTSPTGDQEVFYQTDLGSWEQTKDNEYEFVFEDGFFKEDGDYQLTVSVSDRAGQSTSDSLAFTIDNTKPVITLSQIARFNNEPVTQDIEIIENNYRNNEVTIDVYRENNQGRFVEYNHSKIKNWRNSGRTSRLSLDFDRDGAYRVVVNAEDAAGNQATTVSQTFTVDQIDPSLSIRGVSDQKHYNRNRQVNVRVEDTNIDPNRTNLIIDKLNQSTGEMEHYRSVPDVTYEDTSAKWSHVFNTNDEGVFRIRLNATDRAGNRNSHDPILFTIDKTAPILQANGVVDGEYYGSNRRVEFVVRERHFVENTVGFEVTRNGQNMTSVVEGQNGSTWRNASARSLLNYHFNQDGAYTVSMQAEDAAGNVAQTVNKNFVIDTVDPVIEIEGVDNGEYYNMDRPMSVTIRDVNLDQQTIRVTRDGIDYPVGNFSITNNRYQNSIASLSHTFSGEGEYEVFVEAVDQAGNRDQSQLSFTIDKTAPEITPRMGAGGTVIEEGTFINQVFTPVFELDNPEEDTIDSVTLNNGPNIAGSIPIAGQEMTYQYTVIASDRAGNSTELTVSFVVDTTMPALTISGIFDGYFNESMAPMIEYADDNLDEERTVVTLNGAPYSSGTVIQEEQDYILHASIVDLADNITEQTIVFTIDKTAPAIQFNQPMSNQYFNNVLIPEFLIEDMTDYEIIAMTLNGEPYELGQPIETEGKHVLYFEVSDRAGNIKQLTVEFIIDMTAPEFIVEGVEQNERYYESVEISIALFDQEDMIQTITVNGEDYQGEIIDGEDGQLIRMSFSEPDDYHISTIASDLAGNQTEHDLHFEIAEKTIFMKWYENRPLFAGSIIGLLGVTGTGGAVFARKRKNSHVKRTVE